MLKFASVLTSALRAFALVAIVSRDQSRSAKSVDPHHLPHLGISRDGNPFTVTTRAPPGAPTPAPTRGRDPHGRWRRQWAAPIRTGQPRWRNRHRNRPRNPVPHSLGCCIDVTAYLGYAVNERQSRGPRGMRTSTMMEQVGGLIRRTADGAFTLAPGSCMRATPAIMLGAFRRSIQAAPRSLWAHRPQDRRQPTVYRLRRQRAACSRTSSSTSRRLQRETGLTDLLRGRHWLSSRRRQRAHPCRRAAAGVRAKIGAGRAGCALGAALRGSDLLQSDRDVPDHRSGDRPRTRPNWPGRAQDVRSSTNSTARCSSASSAGGGGIVGWMEAPGLARARSAIAAF